MGDMTLSDTANDFTAYERLGGPVVVTEPDGSIAYFNRAFAELVDRDIADTRGQPLWNLVAEPGAAARVREAMRPNRRPRTIEISFARRGDGMRTVAFSSASLPRPDGEAALCVLAGVDVTEERSALRSVEALRLSEERLAVALLSSPVVVFNQDLELRYTWVYSPSGHLLLKDLTGKTDFELLPTREAEAITRVKRGVIERGEGARELVSITIGGEAYHYDLKVEPLRDEAGRVVGITGAGWDVSEQRREEEVQRFMARAGSLLMGTPEGYDVALTRLTELGVPGLGDWFGIEVIEDGAVRRWVVAADPAKAAVAEAIERLEVDTTRPYLTSEAHAGHAILATEMTAEHLAAVAQNEEQHRLLQAIAPCSMICVPLRARGRHIGALIVVSSRSTRRYRERDLEVVEKLAHLVALAVDNAQLYRAAKRAIAARDEVLGVVAHDLRNPLNTILLQLQLMTRRGEPAERRRQTPIDVIRRAAQRMNRLIERMLDVASLEGGGFAVKRNPVNVRDVVAEVVEAQREIAAKAGLALRTETARALPDVLGDRDRLLQALDNLVGNAVKFTPAGGEIVVGAAARVGEVVFWVSDTGRGIPREHQAHVFDRFWRVEKAGPSGAGLGLAIAKGIVAGHGGRIWVKSRAGQGTTFYFTVPAT